MAIDDHSRTAFARLYPDERRHSSIDFLRAANDHFKTLGVPIQRLITDNGPAFCSHDLGHACGELGITQKFTRAYRPRTNSKAERFIQSALREWAYAHAYQNSDGRGAALAHWNHYYNWHRLQDAHLPSLSYEKQHLDSSQLDACLDPSCRNLRYPDETQDAGQGGCVRAQRCRSGSGTQAKGAYAPVSMTHATDMWRAGT